MLALYRGTTAEIFLPLAERATLPLHHFLFQFIPRGGGDGVLFVLSPDEVEGRAERFTFDVDTYFSDAGEGEYLYTVREQESADNLIPAISGRVLHEGIARLASDIAFSHAQPEGSTPFIQPR